MLSSIQRELNSFFGKLQGDNYQIHKITKGALTQARAKLKPEAFIELNKESVFDFYSNAEYLKWKNFRLLAIDGSTLNLPKHKTVTEEFGEMKVGCKADMERSMARISICYDVLNLITLDAQIDSFKTSEGALLERHTAELDLKKDDLLLMDRGYPSIALMYKLNSKGVNFCMRMKESWWTEVDKFNKSGKESQIIKFRLPKKDANLKTELNEDTEFVKVRLVKVKLKEGETEILATSLLDSAKYSNVELGELYHKRWQIEEGYKLYKSRIELEVFSGKTANAIKQDFYAKVFMMNICAIMSFPIEVKVREESKNAKYLKQINRTNAISFIKSAWLNIWKKKNFQEIIKEFDWLLIKSTDIVRKGRHFIRKLNKKKPPSMNFKKTNP